MATTAEEIKIDLDELDRKKALEVKKNDKDEPVEVVKVESDDKPIVKTVLKPEEGLEKLKKQLEEEKIGRANAEQHAREASEAELRAKTEVHGTQLDLLTSAIASRTQSNVELKQKFADALAAQDFNAAAEANSEMNANLAEIQSFKNAKQQLEKAPKPIVRAPADRVDEFVSKLSPQSASWVRAHPEFVRDTQKNRQMLAAHEIALARGYAADSDEYFHSIEKTLDIGQVEIEIDDPMKDAARPRKPAPAAAPVSRSGNGNGSRANVVTLSPQEVEAAGMMKMTPEEYARNKVALKREGRLQ
jgi:hypothetical protein